MGKLYNLTPLTDSWGRGLRLLEIIGQTVGLLLRPVVWIHRGTEWLLSRLVP